MLPYLYVPVLLAIITHGRFLLIWRARGVCVRGVSGQVVGFHYNLQCTQCVVLSG